MLICNSGYAQIKVLSNGNVGIGMTNPSALLEVHNNLTKFSFINNGSSDAQPIYIDRYYSDPRIYPFTNHKGCLGYSSNFWSLAYVDKMWYINAPAQYSDLRFKKDVTSLQNSLDKVLALRGVEYELDLLALGFSEFENDVKKVDKREIGLVAQEVLEIIPEIVEEDSIGYALNYTSLIPYLIEAIKEQDRKIKVLDTKVKNLTTNQTSGASEQKNTETESVTPVAEIPSLGKNRPNPFSENTSIDYFLPASVQNAVLYIYDLQGKQLKSIKVTGRDYGQVTIHGSELQPGMYNYSLIADGQLAGTEKMILTD
jgi:hypothetical protein